MMRRRPEEVAGWVLIGSGLGALTSLAYGASVPASLGVGVVTIVAGILALLVANRSSRERAAAPERSRDAKPPFRPDTGSLAQPTSPPAPLATSLERPVAGDPSPELQPPLNDQPSRSERDDPSEAALDAMVDERSTPAVGEAPESASDPETGHDVDPDVDPDSEREPGPEQPMEAVPAEASEQGHEQPLDPGLEQEPELDPDPELGPDPELDQALTLEPDPDPDPDPVLGPDPESEPISEPAPEPEPISEPDPEPEPDSELGPDLEPEPISEPAPEPEPISEPAPEPAVEPWPTVLELDLREVGVAPSQTAARVVGSAVPTYVSREVDAALDAALQPDALAASGGVVAVRGRPVSGATRTLWEALRRNAGSRPVLVVPAPTLEDPRPLERLAATAEGIDVAAPVIWIDDAHEHLDAGLTLTVLDRLIDSLPGATIALVLSRDRLFLPELVTDPLERWLRASSDAHEVSPELSPTEMSTAASIFPVLGLNPRVTWLPAWFAGADQLRDRYRELRISDPAGARVVQAAVHWWRAGLGAVAPTAALAAIAAASDRAVDVAGSVDLLSSEQEPVLLRWAREDHVQLATAVVDEVVLLDGPATAAQWSALVPHVTPARAMVAGRAAVAADHLDVAEELWRDLASEASTSPAAVALSLGLVAEQRGRAEQAADAYRRAREANDPDVSALAAFHLGGVLESLGHLEDAERTYEEAEASRHTDAAPLAAFNLGWLYEHQRRTEEAEAAYQRALDSGHLDASARAAFNLAWLVERQRRHREAENLYRAALASGHRDIAPMAAVSLAVLLERLMQKREAWNLLERAAASSHPEAAAAAKLRMRGRRRP